MRSYLFERLFQVFVARDVARPLLFLFWIIVVNYRLILFLFLLTRSPDPSLCFLPPLSASTAYLGRCPLLRHLPSTFRPVALVPSSHAPIVGSFSTVFLALFIISSAFFNVLAFASCLLFITKIISVVRRGAKGFIKVLWQAACGSTSLTGLNWCCDRCIFLHKSRFRTLLFCGM